MMKQFGALFEGDTYTACAGCGARLQAPPPGTAFECPKCSRRFTAYAQELQDLSQFGSRIFDYNQGERMKTVPGVGAQIDAAHKAAEINKGICRGMCLDWIRRVLQGGHDSYDRSNDLAKNKAKKGDAQLNALTTRGAWAQALSHDVSFAEYAPRMASKHQELKGRPPRRSILGIEQTGGKDTAVQCPSPKAFVEDLKRDAKFVDNTCALITFKPSETRAGHSVAIHRRNVSEKFHLFDPNSGVYECQSENLENAIEWLVLTEHKMSTPWMSSVIFGRKQQSAQSSSSSNRP
jgi:hypothetical protein